MTWWSSMRFAETLRSASTNLSPRPSGVNSTFGVTEPDIVVWNLIVSPIVGGVLGSFSPPARFPNRARSTKVSTISSIPIRPLIG